MPTFDTPREASIAYAQWIARTGFAPRTKERYAKSVDEFITWVEAHGSMYDDATTNADVRDYAVTDYRREMLTVRKLAPNTVALYLSAVSSFYEWLELGRPNGASVKVTHGQKVGVTEKDDLRSIVRAARRRGPRDYAIVMLMILAGPRVSELAALDVDDVFVNGRSGTLAIRYGKGGEPREVPLPSQLRDALSAWLRERGSRHGEARPGAPLFVTRTGDRMAVRSVQHVVAEVGETAGVHLTPHLLRHTYGRRWVESGGDLAALQQNMGHKYVSTTMRYARPSREYQAEQAERLEIDL